MDELSRKRISEETDTNFFVEAGAGSGKTTQLVARMTAMIKSGIDVRKICAITFTKAAALEFYERFRYSLAKAVKESTEENERHRCADALCNIDLCFMGTIDAFSHLILHEHPLEGHIPSSSSVMENKRIQAVYQREYSNILHGEYGSDLLKKYEVFSHVQDDARKTFTTFFDSVINLRSNKIIYDKPVAGDIDDIFKAEKSEFLQVINRLLSHKEKWGQIKACMPSNDALENGYNTLNGTWDKELGSIISILGKLKNFRLYCEPDQIGIHNRNILFPHESRGKKYYTFDLENSDLYRELKEYQYSATMDFLVSASIAVSDKLRKNGELTYFDYKLYLRDMLRRDVESGGSLIRHIYDRHSHYLIDEFQDTDPMQAEIFFYLTAENPVSDWRKCIPRPGSLFIVGDPKQSIYRFRSADVAAFKEVRKLFEDGAGEILELTRNYRSTNKLKRSFNNIFTNLLPVGTSDQSKFSVIPIDNDTDREFTGIWSYPVIVERMNVKDEEETVADIIFSLVNKPEYVITDTDTKQFRPLKYSDFMVLVNAKKHVSDFARELAARGIPVRAEGKITFTNCPSLMTMSDIMRLIAYPDDKAAFYSVLTSCVFKIPDSELLKLRKYNSSTLIYADEKILDNIGDELRKALISLKNIYSSSHSVSPATLFSKVMDDFRIVEKTGADYLEYLYYALELLRAAEISGEVMSVSDGAEFIRRLINDENTERSLSLQRDENKVHIANIHKVKGLEAPVVILAHPYKRDFSPDKRSEHNVDGDISRFFKLKDQNAVHAETGIFQAAFEREIVSADAEKLRLLYVAVTRARNVLLISDGINSNDETTNNNPWNPLLQFTDGNFFECVHSVGTECSNINETVNAVELYNMGTKNVLENVDVEKTTYKLSLPSQIKLNDVITSENNYEALSSHQNAILVGKLVHRLMENIVSATNLPPAATLIKNILNNFEADEEYAELLNKVYLQITNGGFPQSNGMPNDILSELRMADEVYCEVPFCYSVSDECVPEIWHGVIDLIYKKEGKWHIVDYKTNAGISDLDFKYSGQLNAYKAAFYSVTGEIADAFIYHIDI